MSVTKNATTGPERSLHFHECQPFLAQTPQNKGKSSARGTYHDNQRGLSFPSWALSLIYGMDPLYAHGAHITKTARWAWACRFNPLSWALAISHTDPPNKDQSSPRAHITKIRGAWAFVPIRAHPH